jgi:hypothetical protein
MVLVTIAVVESVVRYTLLGDVGCSLDQPFAYQSLNGLIKLVVDSVGLVK